MTENRTRRSRGETAAPLSPEQTKDWLSRYGRHSRIYAWGFFALVLPVILGVIWWEMGELNEDVLYSFGFAAVVTFLLARWSRRQTAKSWVGVVEELFMKKVRVRRGDDQADDISYKPMARIRIDNGKKHNQHLSQELFEYFQTGDRVFKVPGLEVPEKVVLDGDRRVCLACGSLYGQGSGTCPRCRAPEPDHGTLVRLAGVK